MHLYCQICEKLSNGANRVFDDEHKAPYITYPGDWGGSQWVGYDDFQSIQAKVLFLFLNNNTHTCILSRYEIKS